MNYLEKLMLRDYPIEILENVLYKLIITLSSDVFDFIRWKRAQKTVNKYTFVYAVE